MVYVTLRNRNTKVGRVEIGTQIGKRVLMGKGGEATVSVVDVTNGIPTCMYLQNDKLLEERKEDRDLKKLLKTLAKNKEKPPIDLIDEGFKLLGLQSPAELLNF